MGWDREQARTMKARASERVGEALAGQAITPATDAGDEEAESGPSGVAVGLAPLPDGTFALAVRYRQDSAAAQELLGRLREEFGPDVDVRPTGPVTPQVGPLPTAQATGQTGRVRPLVPGASVAHVDVTAGTLGGFVEVDGVVHAFSNYHVLVGETGAEGDAVLQPGPADGGVDPADRIGTLAAFVPLTAGEPATVDAALSTLDDAAGEVTDGPPFDPTYPAGALTGTAELAGGEQVEKIGRTTGVTQGTVTAIELDGVQVDFGPGLGVLSFDNQIEVEGAGTGPFSQGGDSGSLVYVPDTRAAVGLLFAGGDQGGSNGQGLTYLNPIGAVLEALGAQLVLAADDAAPAPGPGEPDPPAEGEGGDPGGEGGDDAAAKILEQAKLVATTIRDSVRKQVADVTGVTGVGLTRDGDGYHVVVNVTDEQVRERLPETVRANAQIKTTGPIHSQDDGQAT